MIIFRHVTFVYIRPLGGHYYRWKNISKGLCYCSYSSKRKRNQLKEKNLRLFNSTNKEIDVSFRAQNFTIFFSSMWNFVPQKFDMFEVFERLWRVWAIYNIKFAKTASEMIFFFLYFLNHLGWRWSNKSLKSCKH